MPKKKEKQSLTLHQKKVLDALVAFIEANGYAPTQLELANQFGVTRTNIANHMAALEDKGYIKRNRRWRSVEVIA